MIFYFELFTDTVPPPLSGDDLTDTNSAAITAAGVTIASRGAVVPTAVTGNARNPRADRCRLPLMQHVRAPPCQVASRKPQAAMSARALAYSTGRGAVAFEF